MIVLIKNALDAPGAENAWENRNLGNASWQNAAATKATKPVSLVPTKRHALRGRDAKASPSI